MTKRFSFLNLLLAVFLLSILPGCESSDGGEGREWFAPRLERLDVLVLRWRGTVEDHFRLRLTTEEGQVIEEHDLDTTNAYGVGRGEERLRIVLKKALWAPCKVHLTPLAGGGEQVSLTVSPKSLIDRIVSPLQALRGNKLTAVLKEITALRVQYANDRVKDRVASTLRARRKLSEILQQAGLKEQYVHNVRQQFAKMDAPATITLAKKLLPLRYVEAVIGEIRGLLPPFGNLSAHLGYAVSRDFELGWQVYAENELAKLVNSPDDPGKKLLQWNWMATDKFLGPMRKLGPEAMALAMSRLAFIAPGEAGVQPAQILSSKEFTLETLPKMKGKKFKELRLDMFARHFDRERVVTARLNNSPPMPIVNNVYHDTRRVARFHFHPFWWHLKVPKKYLKEENNVVKLTVSVLPHENPRLPLRMKTLRLSFR